MIFVFLTFEIGTSNVPLSLLSFGKHRTPGPGRGQDEVAAECQFAVVLR